MIALQKGSYVIDFPIPAIAKLPNRGRFLTVLCPGSVVRLSRNANDDGLVRVHSGDCAYTVFVEDLWWYARRCQPQHRGQ